MSFLNDIKKYYKAALLVNVILIIFIGYQLFYSKYYWLGEDEKIFTIEPGKNLDEIISGLKAADVISNSFLLKLAVKLSFKENQIISRSYLFKNGMNNSELISILTDKFSNPLIKITIPPGYNIRQIGKIAENKLSLSKDKFIKEASNDSLINLLGLTGQIKNLEGFLYPDTYEVSLTIKEKGLIILMFNEFRKKVLDDSEIQSQIREQSADLSLRLWRWYLPVHLRKDQDMQSVSYRLQFLPEQ